MLISLLFSFELSQIFFKIHKIGFEYFDEKYNSTLKYSNKSYLHNQGSRVAV